MTCTHCGYLDVPEYDEEIPLCPACGAILREENLHVVSWLAQWPANRRSGLANLFYAAVRRGYVVPAAIVNQVIADIQRRLQWTMDFDTRQYWYQVLATIENDLAGVQRYAAEVVATEQLPAAEKARRKEERAKVFVLEAMCGKAATEKQHWLLRTKGYTGPLPTDRAEASALIDALLQQRGGAA